MLKTIIAVLTLLPAILWGAERNDVPSCYEMTKLTQFAPSTSGRMLTVVVDQTTPLTKDLQKTAWNHIKRFVKPGDKLRMYSFSAYLEGHYTRLQFAGLLERSLEEDVIGNVPIMHARKLNNCLKTQPKQLWQRFGKAFAQAMGRASTDIPRSEILFSLKEISQDLAKAKGIDEYVVLIMSDMLEHSDFASFYTSNRIQDIDAEQELKKVEQQNLFGDFGSKTQIYVHGGAFVPQETKHGYRSGKLIQNLESFWAGYFKRSNAELKGFGHPELTTMTE